MRKKNSSPDIFELRRRAEKSLKMNNPKVSSQTKPEELQRLVHELEVHQIELEMQNEELLQARFELEATLGRYTDFYDYAPVSYFILDPNGVIKKVNLAGAHLFGVERSHLLSQPFRRFLSAEILPTFSSFLAKIFTNQAKETCVVTLRNNANEPRYVQIEAIVSEDGRECRLAVLDVTASKHAEEEYNAIISTSLDGFLIINKQGHILKANEAYSRLIGYTSEELLTMHLQDVEALEKPPETVKHIVRIIKNGFDRYTTLHRCKDGNVIDLEVNVNFVPTQGGRLIMFLQDITLQKKVEVQLKQSEHEKNVILSSMTEKVVYHDKEMKIRWANKAACDFFGVQPDVVQGKSCIEMLGCRNADCVGCPVKLVLETGNYHQNTISYAAGNTLHISAHPVFDADGSISGVVEVSLDVTERFRMETELTKAKEECAAANAAKSSFLSYMSHEMRTPMSVIIGMAHLVYDSVQGQEEKENIDMIRESAAFLLTLINRILDLSKIEAGMLELAQVPFQLSQEIERTIASFALQAKNKGLKLSYYIAENVPEVVTGDPTRLHQVLVNLIGNAIKFTERGSIEVRILADNVGVHFFINDSGIGIPPDKIDRLFHVFTQVNASGFRTYEGTGLGLSISKNLVELMGGSIGVKSEENRGSTFYFTIPFVQPTVERENTEMINAAKESIEQQQFHGEGRALKILLVEDKLMNQRLAKVLLEKKGYKITTALNGREALELLKPHLFDLILMDIHMPVMDGLEATSRIRASEDEAIRRIPIIAMTAYAMQEDRDTCLRAGMNYYISKPVNSEELFYTLAKVMEDTNSHTFMPEGEK